MSYLVEGKSSRDFKVTKQLLHNQPELAHRLLSKIARVTTDYLNMQIEAGVTAVQLFDSWAEHLCWDDYQYFAHRYVAEIIAGLTRKDITVFHLFYGILVFVS